MSLRNLRVWSISLFIICLIIIAVHSFLLYGEIMKLCEEDLIESQTASSLSPYKLIELFHHLFHSSIGSQADLSDNTLVLCSETWIQVLFIIFTEKIPSDVFNFLSYISETITEGLHFFSFYSLTIVKKIFSSLQFPECIYIVFFSVVIVIAIMILKLILWNRKFSPESTKLTHKNSESLQLTPITSSERNKSQVLIKTFSHQGYFSCYLFIQWIFLLVMLSVTLSIPWEFLRLYQKAVASHAANVVKGLPAHCTQMSVSWFEKFQALLRWHFSWSQSHDDCQEYYYASLVDPLWEVSPLKVLSSVFAQGILHPLEIASSSLGRSVRAFFAEIPMQWQPLIMLVAVVMSMVLLLMTCRYRLSIPLFLRIEPKTPVTSPSEKERSRGTRTSFHRDALDYGDMNGKINKATKLHRNDDHFSNSNSEHRQLFLSSGSGDSSLNLYKKDSKIRKGSCENDISSRTTNMVSEKKKAPTSKPKSKVGNTDMNNFEKIQLTPKKVRNIKSKRK